MRVKKLIKLLKEFDPDMRIETGDGYKPKVTKMWATDDPEDSQEYYTPEELSEAMKEVEDELVALRKEGQDAKVCPKCNVDNLTSIQQAERRLAGLSKMKAVILIENEDDDNG